MSGDEGGHHHGEGVPGEDVVPAVHVPPVEGEAAARDDGDDSPEHEDNDDHDDSDDDDNHEDSPEDDAEGQVVTLGPARVVGVGTRQHCHEPAAASRYTCHDCHTVTCHVSRVTCHV